MTKSSARTARRKTRHKPRKVASKTVGKVGKKVATERVHTQQKMDAPLWPFRSATVHDTFRGLAERNVTQTRELYEHSKSTLQAILESWQKTFGAADQGAVALNRRIIDIADRNINNTFNWAADLAGAKDLTEVMEAQAAYWRKQLVAGSSRELRSSPKRRNQ
jgi:hypothetical protein